ncbi:hypothetical protein DENSPDRAFT_85298 [Dentipellis sp. KUC8613]|nr:hypothetical protein DENSPDRAFT_85298 [Dentipellis sp. KUC8613]
MLAVHHLLMLASLATSGLANPLAPRDSATQFSACTNPIQVSNSSVQVGANTVTLTTLACTAQLQSAGLLGILCPILGLFCPIPKPHPKPKPKPTTITVTKTKTDIKTTTKTTTDTKTKTITSSGTTQTVTITSTGTVTDTITDTETETDTITDTVTDSVTDTITDTDTVTATSTLTVSPSPSPTPKDVCGIPCNTTCSEVGQLPPTTDDCQVIKDSIAIFQGNAAPTFTVDPLHITQLTFGTCRFFFENLGTVPLEYCWQDLANTGSLAATQCFPPNSPFSTLATCEAADSSWEVGVSHS